MLRLAAGVSILAVALLAACGGSEEKTIPSPVDTVPTTATPLPSATTLQPGDPEVYAIALAHLQEYLDTWVREGPAAAKEMQDGPRQFQLLSGQVSSYKPFTYDSDDSFTLIVKLDLHFPPGQIYPWTVGNNGNIFFTFTRPDAASPFVMRMSSIAPLEPAPSRPGVLRTELSTYFGSLLDCDFEAALPDYLPRGTRRGPGVDPTCSELRFWFPPLDDPTIPLEERATVEIKERRYEPPPPAASPWMMPEMPSPTATPMNNSGDTRREDEVISHAGRDVHVWRRAGPGSAVVTLTTHNNDVYIQVRGIWWADSPDGEVEITDAMEQQAFKVLDSMLEE